MRLSQLIININHLGITGETNKDVKGVNIDSRKVVQDHLFIAVRGTQADGHNFISKAIEAGASVIVCEELPADINPEVTYIKVENSESVVGHIATAFYGNPTLRMQLVGVTGTNGKTTIATVLYNMFRKMGYKAGLISTVVNYIDGEAVPTPVRLFEEDTVKIFIRDLNRSCSG